MKAEFTNRRTELKLHRARAMEGIIEQREFILNSARCCLKKIWNESGSVLYSGRETLNVGDVYMLGTNPGGSPQDHINNPIGNIGPHMERSWKSDSNHNCYWDEQWGSQRKIGRNPLQRRVRWLLCNLTGCECGGESDACFGKEICASNLIFLRSPELAKLKMNPKEAADLCWGVHNAIMSRLVLPRVIVAFGWPYWYLRKRFFGKPLAIIGGMNGDVSEEEILNANQNNMKCRRFMTTMEFGSRVCTVYQQVWIFGIPHLSRYAPDKRCPKIADWIKEKLPLTETDSQLKKPAKIVMRELVERKVTLDLGDSKEVVAAKIEIARLSDGNFIATPVGLNGRFFRSPIYTGRDKNDVIETGFLFLRRGWEKAMV